MYIYIYTYIYICIYIYTYIHINVEMFIFNLQILQDCKNFTASEIRNLCRSSENFHLRIFAGDLLFAVA